MRIYQVNKQKSYVEAKKKEGQRKQKDINTELKTFETYF